MKIIKKRKSLKKKRIVNKKKSKRRTNKRYINMVGGELQTIPITALQNGIFRDLFNTDDTSNYATKLNKDIITKIEYEFANEETTYEKFIPGDKQRSSMYVKERTMDEKTPKMFFTIYIKNDNKDNKDDKDDKITLVVEDPQIFEDPDGDRCCGWTNNKFKWIPMMGTNVGSDLWRKLFKNAGGNDQISWWIQTLGGRLGLYVTFNDSDAARRVAGRVAGRVAEENAKRAAEGVRKRNY